MVFGPAVPYGVLQCRASLSRALNLGLGEFRIVG